LLYSSRPGYAHPGLFLLIVYRCAMLYFYVGGCPTASDFLLRGQEKVTKEKAAPAGAGLL